MYIWIYMLHVYILYLISYQFLMLNILLAAACISNFLCNVEILNAYSCLYCNSFGIKQSDRVYYPFIRLARKNFLIGLYNLEI